MISQLKMSQITQGTSWLRKMDSAKEHDDLVAQGAQN
jgi:hypothetical protein